MKNFATILLLMALLFAGLAPVLAAPEPVGQIDFSALDSAIAAQMSKHGLRGVSLAITQGEEIIYLKGYGSAGRDRPMTPQTPMYIGSQSKSFTALGIAQLAEQGLVELDAPVREYIPWFAIADEEASQKITVAHFLHHTSGLSDAGFLSILSKDATIDQGVRALQSAKLTAPVGTRFQYFNMGYVVLAYIIENLAGQPYAEYIQQHIFEPLQMKSTFTDPDLAVQAGLSQGYSRFFGFVVPAPQPSPVYELSAGYIISSAEDMARYAIAMNNQGVYAGESLLSEQWLAEMFSPVKGYGMGWFVGNDHIYHGGANETFKTFVHLYPSRNLGIVLLINQGYMMDHYISAGQVFNAVEAIVLGRKPLPASAGWSVTAIGRYLMVLVLGLCLLHTWNIYHLKNWTTRARAWSPLKLGWDVTLSFLIPTVILVIVFTQIKAFFGDRLNLTYQLLVMFRTLPDISILMLVGSLPDYAQGVAKLVLLRKIK